MGATNQELVPLYKDAATAVLYNSSLRSGDCNSLQFRLGFSSLVAPCLLSMSILKVYKKVKLSLKVRNEQECLIDYWLLLMLDAAPFSLNIKLQFVST